MKTRLVQSRGRGTDLRPDDQPREPQVLKLPVSKVGKLAEAEVRDCTPAEKEQKSVGGKNTVPVFFERDGCPDVM